MRGVRATRVALAGAAIVAVTAVAACSSGARRAGTSGAPGTTTSTAAPVLVALGDAATGRLDSGAPIRASWPQEFYRAAMPRETVFVNLATDIAQTAGARLFETPLLKGLHPTTV